VGALLRCLDDRADLLACDHAGDVAREELEHVVGANAARAVIDYFAQTSR